MSLVDVSLDGCSVRFAAVSGEWTRLWYEGWREEDWARCASARERIHSLSAAGLPQYHRMIYAHLEVLQGNYSDALRELEAGIPTANEPTSMMVNFFALSGITLALLFSGRWGDLMRLVRTGKEIAERNGNAPWLLHLPRSMASHGSIGFRWGSSALRHRHTPGD
jgi:hypothetical protein